MIRRALLCLSAIIAPLAAAEGPWDRLGEDTLMAVRWHGDGPARAAVASYTMLPTLVSPAMLEALGGLVTDNAAEPGLGSLLASLAARGAGREDLAAVLGGECGVATVAAGKQAMFLAWATVPEATWERLMAECAAQAGQGTLTISDRTAGGHAVRVFTAPGDTTAGGVAVLREAGGRCWIAAAPELDGDTLAAAAAGWLEARPGERSLARRAAAGGLFPATNDALLLEAVADLPRVARIVRESPGDDRTRELGMAITHLGGMGFAGLEMRVDGGTVRSRLALQCPGPRGGAMRMFDAPGQEPAIPAWIPERAISVSTMTMDLARMWSGVREAMLAVQGDEARANLEQMDTMVPAFTGGLTLDEILAALGSRWWMIDLPEPAGSGPEVEHLAIVVDLGDPAVMTRLLPLANMMGGAAGGIRFVTEQGAQGLRIGNDEDGGAGIFIAGERLVIGIGAGVAEDLLAALVRGDGAWARTAPAREGLPRLPGRPLLGWVIEDYAKTLTGAMDSVRGMMEMMPLDDGHPERLAAILAALPTGEALAACVTGPATAVILDDAGTLRIESETRFVVSAAAP
jgi:hypothetical protein